MRTAFDPLLTLGPQRTMEFEAPAGAVSLCTPALLWRDGVVCGSSEVIE
jgi:hypothetical protein